MTSSNQNIKTMKKLHITILTDNRCPGEGLLCEHGLSIWIEVDNKRILFDTGQSDLLFHNAAKLGINLKSVDILVLSHGHYDHTSGVSRILELNPEIKVFCHPHIFKPRYSRHTDGEMKFIGMSLSACSSLNRVSGNINWLTKPLFAGNEAGITGPIPRETDFEDTGGDFYYDREGYAPDPITDDMAIWFKSNKGLIIISGCCHSGIVNTSEYSLRISSQEKIRSVVGGFHLHNASSERINKTVEYLKEKSIETLIPLHCTGNKAIELLNAGLGETVIEGQTGTRITFDL